MCCRPRWRRHLSCRCSAGIPEPNACACWLWLPCRVATDPCSTPACAQRCSLPCAQRLSVPYGHQPSGRRWPQQAGPPPPPRPLPLEMTWSPGRCPSCSRRCWRAAGRSRCAAGPARAATAGVLLSGKLRWLVLPTTPFHVLASLIPAPPADPWAGGEAVQGAGLAARHGAAVAEGCAAARPVSPEALLGGGVVVVGRLHADARVTLPL